MSIDRLQMMTLLLEACPSFEPAWRGFLTDWAGEPELPYYVALGTYARHLSLVLAQGDVHILRKVFDTLERLVVEGDSYVQDAAVCGLIEDLQNANLHTGTNPEQFLPFLLPESHRWWAAIEAQWTERDTTSP